MIWLMIGLAALSTLGTRVLFGLLPQAWQLPPRMQAWLEYLPGAVFSALAMPGLVREGTATPALSSSKILASVVGAYVAWHTRHLVLALVAGMLVLWLDVWVS